MSKISNFDYTSTSTFWSKTTDPYGQPSYAVTIRVVQGWNDQTFSPDDLPDWAVLSG
ncbi:hypothetical protein [Sulfitobacter dubius]|uniref:hypothetical protein n=1 Tax=Sulfitobacter dubius TaxID=218673 RepID=UPI00294212E0|nr:hypothetical protein [Sulfitobacter dubius]WOI29354.1 hypothetical protein R1T39_01190 [Sulfitobacter dubius]